MGGQRKSKTFMGFGRILQIYFEVVGGVEGAGGVEGIGGVEAFSFFVVFWHCS